MDELESLMMELCEAISGYPMVREFEVKELEEVVIKLSKSIKEEDGASLEYAKQCHKMIVHLSTYVRKQLNQHDFASDRGAMSGYQQACENTEIVFGRFARKMDEVCDKLAEEHQETARSFNKMA